MEWDPVLFRGCRDRRHRMNEEERDEIRDRMQALEASAAPHRSAYQLECVFTASTETGPAQVS